MDWVAYAVNEQIRITEMFSLFELECDSSYEFPGETHDFWECVYVISGAICVSTDEKVYDLNEGDIIFHKPLELHKFYVTDDNTRLLIFSYSAEGKLNKYFRESVFSLSAEQKGIIKNTLDYIHKKVDELDISVRANDACAYLTPFEKIPSYSQAVITYLHSLMLSIGENSTSISASTSYESVIFSDAVKYMKDNIRKSPSVEDIAKYAGTGVSTIKRVFKHFSGTGVHKYFLKLKLRESLKELQNGMSVTQTAEIFGFSSQGYFTNVFKREMGITPSNIAKNNNSK